MGLLKRNIPPYDTFLFRSAPRPEIVEGDGTAVIDEPADAVGGNGLQVARLVRSGMDDGDGARLIGGMGRVRDGRRRRGRGGRVLAGGRRRGRLREGRRSGSGRRRAPDRGRRRRRNRARPSPILGGAADEQDEDHERADRRVTEDRIAAQERRREAQGLADAGADVLSGHDASLDAILPSAARMSLASMLRMAWRSDAPPLAARRTAWASRARSHKVRTARALPNSAPRSASRRTQARAAASSASGSRVKPSPPARRRKIV